MVHVVLVGIYTRLVHCLLHLHQCRYKYEKLQECYRGVLVVNIMSDDPCVPNNEHSLGVRPRGIKVVGQDLLLQVVFRNIGDERGCHGNVRITGFLASFPPLHDFIKLFIPCCRSLVICLDDATALSKELLR